MKRTFYTETRIYVLDTERSIMSESEALSNWNALSDEKFMCLAVESGQVYDLDGFQDAVNNDDFWSPTSVIRIITARIATGEVLHSDQARVKTPDPKDVHKRPRAFYNTTEERGALLAKLQQEAKTMNDRILKFFVDQPDLKYSPPEVQQMLKIDCISSVRRAITTLTNQGYLRKSDLKVTGLYGKEHPNFCWYYPGGSSTKEQAI